MMDHKQLVNNAERAIESLISDTSVPASQTKGELLTLIGNMQDAANAIEGDADADEEEA